MKREKWILTASMALLVLSCAWSAGAQETDCSKCETKTGPYNYYVVNQAICPGANAVVCVSQFQKQYEAKCQPNGIELRDCKPAVMDHTYPAKAFPANRCGTLNLDQNGDVISAACGNPGNGNTTVDDKLHYCTGKPWDPTIAVDIAMAYTLDVTTPYGPTTLNGGANQLDSTIVSISSELLSAAREQGLLEDDGRVISLRLEIEPNAASGVSFPDQRVPALVLSGNPVVGLAAVENGSVVLELEIPSANLGAFAEYSLDLQGLLVEYESAARTFSAPEDDGIVAVPVDLYKDAAALAKSTSRDLVSVSLTLSSGGRPLVASSEAIGSLP